MLWKIYVWLFAIINILSIASVSFDFSDTITILSLTLNLGLNVAVFSYAYKKHIFSKLILNWIFKLNVGMYGLFILFEFLALIQEVIGAGIDLPTSGLVSVIASIPNLPALYATYKMLHHKEARSKKKKKS